MQVSHTDLQVLPGIRRLLGSPDSPLRFVILGALTNAIAAPALERHGDDQLCKMFRRYNRVSGAHEVGTYGELKRYMARPMFSTAGTRRPLEADVQVSCETTPNTLSTQRSRAHEARCLLVTPAERCEFVFVCA